MILAEFEKCAEALFKEYFQNGDTQEVADTLEEYNIKNFKAEVKGPKCLKVVALK